MIKRLLIFLFLTIAMCINVYAVEYDFSNLGSEDGDFKPQGNRFLVSKEFIQEDVTKMYYNVSDETVNEIVIKADCTNIDSFDFENMSLNTFESNTYNLSIIIEGDLKNGGTTSQSVTNISISSLTSLTDMGMDFSGFDDVTELRINMTVHSSKVYYINFETITISDEKKSVIIGTTPSVQASDLTAASTEDDTINIWWQNGNGSKRVIFVKQGNAGTPAVSDGVTYEANSDFSNADDIGSGWKCVFNSTQQLTSISGLAEDTQYRIVVYELDGNGGGEKYLISTGTNIINHSTSPSGHTRQAKPILFF